MASTSPPGPSTPVRAVVVRPDHHLERPDSVATEEPLEIRAAGPGQASAPVAVTMRTPGSDFELAVGYLRAEGLIGPADVAAVGYCADVEPELRFNTVTVSLRAPWQGPVRASVVAASCGVCGKASIDEIALDCPVVPAVTEVSPAVVAGLPDALRTQQRVFARTGGLHAAGAFAADGTCRVVREDVGRHNAVDKVIGHLLLRPQGPAPLLAVSGRVSFEIVQKAAVAGFELIAAVSAPSSLAVAAAGRLGVTLAGFVRDGSFNIYSHPGRVALG